MNAQSYSSSEMMTVAAARALGNDDICFVGIGLPSAACNLARLTHAPRLTLVYESGTCPLTVLHADGRVDKPTLPGGDDATAAFTLELRAAVGGIAAGKEPDLLSGQLARDALVLCHKECESVRSGQPVAVASEK